MTCIGGNCRCIRRWLFKRIEYLSHVFDSRPTQGRSLEGGLQLVLLLRLSTMASMPTSQQLTPNPHKQPLPAPCYIFKFPNELVAETISWLPHPVDILGLSFTCKRFHNLLVDPAASYIWKNARERFVMIQSFIVFDKSAPANYGPEDTEIIKISDRGSEIHLRLSRTPIPPPLENQAEYDFAKMLFGWKMCQRCQKGYIGKLFNVLMRFALCPVRSPVYQPNGISSDARIGMYGKARKGVHVCSLYVSQPRYNRT
jgi:hypothetical protein